MEYRKKPVVINAVRWMGTNIDEVRALIGSNVVIENLDDSLTIPTLEGDMLARKGDWVIRGVQGEVYPCKHDIFEATYDRVS